MILVEVDAVARYRNYLLPLMDCVSIVLGYYLVSVLITDSFLMQPTSAITRNEILISIILAIIVFQIVFRLSKRYSNIIRYENNQDYILYIILSLISSLIVSLIEDLVLNMKNPSIKLNLIVGLVIGIIMISYRLIIRYVLLSDVAHKGLKNHPDNQKKLLIIGGGYSANDIIKTLNSTLKGRYDIVGIIDDNKNGFLVPLNDVEGFVNALNKLINDAELRERMGAAAKEKVEDKFSEKSIVEKLDDVFTNALEVEK